MTPETPRFSIHPSPIGDVLIVTIEGAVVTLHPLSAPLGVELGEVALRLRAAPEAGESEVADAAAQQLDEYFAGERRSFEVALDWRLVHGFTRTALEAVCEIPYGETAGYGEVAIRAGSPGAARAVGTACARTPFSLVVPVHRVVRSDGSLGEYGGRPEVKRHLIELEQTTLERETLQRAGV